MWTKLELIEFVLKRERELIRLIPERERRTKLEPEPEPQSRSKPVPANQTFMESLQRKALEAEARGECVTMNTLLRSVPKPRPPRKPSWEL